MGSLFLNRLSEQARSELVATLHSTQNGNCFICRCEIDLALHGSSIDIDHVEPTSSGGKDGLDNFAITHASCNRTKQAANLRVARVLASFGALVESIAGENRSPNLGDVLHKHGGSKYDLPVKLENGSVKTCLPELGQNDVSSHPIYEDHISKFRSSFLELPIEYLYHDDHLNPRAIGNNLRKLVVEFQRELPQLHVALAWIDTSRGDVAKVKIFDGQHKAAAQILLGTRRLPVRVFIDPNIDALLTANTNAGTTLRQVAFDKSVQRSLGSSILGDRITRYIDARGLDPENESFSERDLVNHFKGESRAMRRYIIDRVRNSVTTHGDNKLRDYIEYGGRGKDRPLSYSTVEKTFYQFFIYGDVLTAPFNHKFEEGTNPRQLEIEQIVHLMNIIADKVYVGKFDPTRGIHKLEHDVQQGKHVAEPHLRAFRMAKEEIIYNWLQYVKQIVLNYFITMGQPIDQNKLFQYRIPDKCWENIENFMESLIRLPLWVNKELSLSAFGGKRNSDYWQAVFESGKSPDNSDVMATGLNLMEMIQPRQELP